MNERIQELIKQSTTIEFGVDNGFDRETFDKEKFAELLLMECITIIEEQKEYYSNPGSYESREYYERCAAKADAYDDAAGSIRYRFGIKK